MQLQDIQNQLLRKHHLFNSLSDSDMSGLMQSTHIDRVKKDEFLFQQGEKANRFYFVISGCMKLFRILPDGTEKIIELIPANHSFAEALMFAGQDDYPVSAQAVESTEVFCFSNKDYLEILGTKPGLSLELLGDLSRRLRMMLNEIEVLSLKNSTHRVVRYLMSQMVTVGNNSCTFELPVAKRLIASQLAIQPETFSRILNRLKVEGILEIKGREVTVFDPESLLSYE